MDSPHHPPQPEPQPDQPELDHLYALFINHAHGMRSIYEYCEHCQGETLHIRWPAVVTCEICGDTFCP